MIILGLTILGLCIGSFINALEYRLHWQAKHKKASKEEKRKYSIGSGRSICPNCGHKLANKDLIPIVSWLTLGGKCRYCRKPISWQYPAIEALTVGLFIVSYIFWPYSLTSGENIVAFWFWLVFLSGLVALALYDIKHLILPNKIVFPLLILAGIFVLAQSILQNSFEPLTTSITGALIGGGLFYVLFQVSNGAWIGGGDVKLGFLLGILVGGPWPAVLMLFLASFLGTVYSAPLLLAKKIKPKSRVPFGPFLITAAIIVQLFGAGIIDWYLRSFTI